MQKYEYKTLTVGAKGFWGGKFNEIEIDNTLNHMVRNGWELVNTTTSNQAFGETRCILFIFKRPID